MDKTTKHIFVTGGVVSGIGKGITAASLGRLLKARGLKVMMQKFDPYINVDPGMMSPLQHGEVFVTDDGVETDLDLGHYERFIDENLGYYGSATAGKIYWAVIHKERAGEYGGSTVQVIPHITNEIKDRIYKAAAGCDVVITEIGGTVGDIEGQPFLEAIRQVSSELGHENCLFIHVTLIPYLVSSGELKSKPTQHSTKELLSIGIQPDIIVCRTEKPLPPDLKSKIGLFCNISADSVIENGTVDTLYEVPLMLEREGMARAVCKKLGWGDLEPDLEQWTAMVDAIKSPERRVKIALVGSYVTLHDAYLSLAEALGHGGIPCRAEIEIKWIDPAEVTPLGIKDLLGDCDGLVIPGTFEDEGFEGKMLCVTYARENDMPFLGLCLGMQLMAIEYAQSVLKMPDASFAPINPDARHQIAERAVARHAAPTESEMCLGVHPCVLSEGSRAREIYGAELIYERHRHLYRFNAAYRELFENGGALVSGASPDGKYIDIIEVPGMRFYMGAQFSPEFKSRPNRPHPLISEFVRICADSL